MINQANIIRDNRKNVKITISTKGELFVFAPKRLSIEKLKEIVEQKQEWIQRKIAYIKSELEKNKYIITNQDFLLYGKGYKIEYYNNKKITVEDDKILFPIDKKDNLIESLKKWYKKLANQILIPRLNQLATKLNLKYSMAKIVDVKAKWGSCDSKQNIKLNYKLIMLPYQLIDFVLIHELIHLIELNHSKQYFLLLSKALPDWKQRRAQIKKYAFLLGLYK